MPRLFDATVKSNTILCREHYRLVLTGVNISDAGPGQFLHLGPTRRSSDSSKAATKQGSMEGSWPTAPMLRRAFSIAGLRELSSEVCEMEVIYRVVGTATRWMSSLRPHDVVSVMGPLGNSFPIQRCKQHAWMVGGGVGLPPMLWLSEFLHRAGRRTLAFVGSQRADLVPLTITDPAGVGIDGRTCSLAARELAVSDTPVVISTDDGSLGFKGYVGSALTTYFLASGVACDDLVVYACGPESMMEQVGRFCLEASIECYVCLERAMACGTGTCQSCVVRVRDETANDGWRYELCCTQGPVFDAERVIWAERTGPSVKC